MYNLIVTAEKGAWDGTRYVLPQERIAEYTDDSLKARYRVLDDQTTAELMSLQPCLLTKNRAISLPESVGSPGSDLGGDESAWISNYSKMYPLFRHLRYPKWLLTWI